MKRKKQDENKYEDDNSNEYKDGHVVAEIVQKGIKN